MDHGIGAVSGYYSGMVNGSDTGLLLLHALPLDGRMWQAQRGLLSGRTYAPDLYGFGDDIEIWAKSALDLVPHENIVVVGNSVGGSCALEVARVAPDRVAGLALIGTKAHVSPDRAALAEAIGFVDDNGVAAAWERYWSPFIARTPDDDTAWQAARRIACAQSAEHLVNGLKAFHQRPSRAALVAELDIPVAVISGDRDSLPGVAYSRALAATARQGVFHMIPDCGHYVPMVQAARLNDILARFLASLGVA